MTNEHPIQLNMRLITAGAILAGVGGALWLAGMIVSGSALATAGREWMRQLDQPPSELAKSKWQQMKVATAAGSDAWKKGPQAS